jgi:hypothetical protein
MVRANLSQVIIGNTNRATESRHATGAESEIPDISEYSRGRKDYFQAWDPQAKEITARGRTFLLGVPPDESNVRCLNPALRGRFLTAVSCC